MGRRATLEVGINPTEGSGVSEEGTMDLKPRCALREKNRYAKAGTHFVCHCESSTKPKAAWVEGAMNVADTARF
jgi:hypothetical protein